MIGEVAAFAGGLLVANAGEWVIHRFVLHGLGKKKESMWAFHWREHHNACRRNEFLDPDYQRTPLVWNAQGKELVGLLALAVIVSPATLLSTAFVTGVWLSLVVYYLAHKRSHLNPEWARRWLPWHYDHHMGRDQDKNWCVTFPLFDWIMGSRTRFNHDVSGASIAPIRHT